MIAQDEKERTLELVRKIIEPILDDAGFELVELQLGSQGRRLCLRVFMDSEEGITVDDCARMSEEISVHLDVNDPIKASYVLEVSSPGLDRPLTRERDYIRANGRKLRIILNEPYEGKNEITGKLVRFENGIVTLANGKGREHKIPVEQVRTARIRF